MQSECHLWRQSSGEHDYGADSVPIVVVVVVVVDRFYIALILCSRTDSLRSHVILQESLFYIYIYFFFNSAFLNIHRSGVLLLLEDT